jgi:hypothetical protein
LRITHPFHPLFGQEFVRVTELSGRHGEQVWYERGDGSVASIPRAWTDLAAPDPFAALAAGQVHFRPESLAELAALVAAIRGSATPKGGKRVSR